MSCCFCEQNWRPADADFPWEWLFCIEQGSIGIRYYWKLFFWKKNLIHPLPRTGGLILERFSSQISKKCVKSTSRRCRLPMRVAVLHWIRGYRYQVSLQLLFFKKKSDTIKNYSIISVTKLVDMIRNRNSCCMSDLLNHSGSICYHSEPLHS